MSKIIRVIDKVHMCMGHLGLKKIAKEAGLNVEKLEAGELVMFLNRDRTKVKILGKQGQLIAYLRTPGRERLDLNALQYIPSTFDGASFSYAKALEKSVLAKLSEGKTTNGNKNIQIPTNNRIKRSQVTQRSNAT